MSRRSLLAALLPLLWLCGPAPAGAELPPAAARLADTVARVRGVKVTFHQIRDVDLTGEEIVADGIIAFRPPGDFRLAYTAPEDQEVVVRGDSLWVITPAENQALRFSFQPGAPGSEIFLLFGGGDRALDEVFAVVQEPWADYPDALLLTPLAADGAYPIEDIRVVVGPDGFPRRLFYREITGDSVAFDFRKVEVDPRDIADLVRLRIPPGMDVLDGEALQDSR